MYVTWDDSVTPGSVHSSCSFDSMEEVEKALALIAYNLRVALTRIAFETIDEHAAVIALAAIKKNTADILSLVKTN